MAAIICWLTSFLDYTMWFCCFQIGQVNTVRIITIILRAVAYPTRFGFLYYQPLCWSRFDFNCHGGEPCGSSLVCCVLSWGCWRICAGTNVSSVCEWWLQRVCDAINMTFGSQSGLSSYRFSTMCCLYMSLRTFHSTPWCFHLLNITISLLHVHELWLCFSPRVDCELYAPACHNHVWCYWLLMFSFTAFSSLR
jgi:hypothetical protein